MIPLIKHFFLDETAFIRFFRASIMAAGAVVATYGDAVPSWIGVVLMSLSMLMGAGDKNPEPNK